MGYLLKKTVLITIRRVDYPPQLRGWGYTLDRDVLGFHFGCKWKLVRWSWGIGGMELIPLLTQFIVFGVWGDQFGGGDGRELSQED